jgi:hypothetical protein
MTQREFFHGDGGQYHIDCAFTGNVWIYIREYRHGHEASTPLRLPYNMQNEVHWFESSGNKPSPR